MIKYDFFTRVESAARLLGEKNSLKPALTHLPGRGNFAHGNHGNAVRPHGQTGWFINIMYAASFEKKSCPEDFSAFSCTLEKSRGRRIQEPPCPIRNPFQLDRDRIVYSNAFRRMKHKTQVFLSPLGDHYRTRLTHTLEVSQIARTISRAMGLNEDLTEAIALGHDLGHPPFGHSGETALKEIYSQSFSHRNQSLRVVDILENKGKGLNLTFEVRDGILKHSKGYGKIIPENAEESACTYEGRIVRIADIMAYLNHDLDDAIRSRVIQASDIPSQCVDVLGKTHSQRATTMIKDLVYSSRVENGVLVLRMSPEVDASMALLRTFLYENVYRSLKVHAEFIKAKRMLCELFVYFLDHRDQLEKELARMELASAENQNSDKARKRVVADFIASMTDRAAMDLYKRIFFPAPLV